MHTNIVEIQRSCRISYRMSRLSGAHNGLVARFESCRAHQPSLASQATAGQASFELSWRSERRLPTEAFGEGGLMAASFGWQATFAFGYAWRSHA